MWQVNSKDIQNGRKNERWRYVCFSFGEFSTALLVNLVPFKGSESPIFLSWNSIPLTGCFSYLFHYTALSPL